MKDILIVEDGSDERERLTKLFSEAEYRVQACSSVAEAEKALQVESFRVALLDIGLSDRSGTHLFSNIKRSGRVSSILIYTGNPSVHLKQRFLDEGAHDYIVKGSPQAQSEALLSRVKELLGAGKVEGPQGMALEEFLSNYVTATSKELFLESDGTLPRCGKCQSTNYIVTFSHEAQVPPKIHGLVVCAGCGKAMNPEVG